MVRESVEISSDDERSSNNANGDNETTLTYKHRLGTIELHTESIKCLNPCYYLKDNIIQFYLAYLLDERCSDENSQRTHIFDTIFYQDIDKVFTDKVDKKKLKESRKWYRHINIFKKDFLIVPICKDDHWKVAIICYPNAVKPIVPRNQTNERNLRKSENGATHKNTTNQRREVPSIIIMDSLGVRCSEVSRKLRDFLDYEWRRGLSISKVVKRFSYDDLRDYYPKLPRQRNTYDCGLFMLVYIKVFLKEPDLIYDMIRSEKEEKVQRLKDIIETNLSRTTRETIRELILRKTCQD